MFNRKGFIDGFTTGMLVIGVISFIVLPIAGRMRRSKVIKQCVASGETQEVCFEKYKHIKIGTELPE